MTLRCSRSPLAPVVAAFATMLVALPATTEESPTDRLWNETLIQAQSCGTAFNETMSAGVDCLFGRGFGIAFDESTRLAAEYGKQYFGQHFQIVGNLTYSPASGQSRLLGDLDMVMPLSGGELADGREDYTSAFFYQQGITRWWDDSGSLHNDLRNGLVYRFRVTDEADADAVGVSLLHLVNAERNHQVVVPVIDYAGKWGTAAFRYFSPTTGWKTTRPGYAEKALEGVELAAGVDVTSTLRVSATGYGWEEKNGSGRWNEGGRLDIGWQPHPWLNFGAGYDRTGDEREVLSFVVGLRVPLGSPAKAPRWEGLGVTGGNSGAGPDSLWRPTEGVGQIQVATTATPASLVADAEVRFLQDTVNSGSTVRLEVVLPEAAQEDIRVAVRLVPGSGENPAVAGEDFVDEAVETTIAAGNATVELSIQLLDNNGLQEERSLGATVSLVS